MDLKKALPYSHQTGYGRAFLAYLFSPALQAPRVRSAAKLTEGASQDGETERGAGTGHSHVSNVSTVFAHTMKPTVATISTKSRFHAYQRIPRFQRKQRNHGFHVPNGCHEMRPVRFRANRCLAWNRGNVGIVEQSQDCAPAAGHPQKGGLLAQTAVVVPFRWPPSLPSHRQCLRL